MNLAVIGAGGFLGSALVSHFTAAECEVGKLSFRPEKLTEFLQAFASLLKNGSLVAVLNASASQHGGDDPAALEELVASNVLLPAALASLIRLHSPATCLISFGTSWQIGETGMLRPFNAYAASKTASEAFMNHFAQDGLRLATLRLYDTYGPGDRRNKIVNLIADSLIKRSELAMSAGRQVIDLVHIHDVVRAVEATLTLLRNTHSGVHHVFAVRSGRPLTILEVLETMKRAAGASTADFIKPGIYAYRKRERFVLFPDTPTPPGWRPGVALEEGMRGLLEDRSRATKGGDGADIAS